LIGLFSRPSSVAASSILGLLGADTCRANVKDTVHVREPWDTISMLMGIDRIVITWMSEALMPEKSFSGSLDGRHQSVSLDVLMERECMKLYRQLGHLLT